MNNSKPQLYFLLFTLVITLVLTFFVFRPFIYVLILAIIFATVFHPVYIKITNITKGSKSVSAFATVIVIVILILTPLILLGTQISQEAQQLYVSLSNGSGRDTVIINTTLNNLNGYIEKYVPEAQSISTDIKPYLKDWLSWLVGHFGTLLGSFARLATASFIFLIAVYYLLKDGQKLKKTIIVLSPLSDNSDEIVFKKVGLAINSIMKGSLMVALIQGILTIAGFMVTGIPNVFLWGSTATISALVPGVGTALVFIPAIIFLILTAKPIFALGLFIWWIGVVGLIDNFLRPKFVEGDIQIHPLIILLSILGGINFFGLIGFILGPLLISLLFALLDIYSSLVKKEYC